MINFTLKEIINITGAKHNFTDSNLRIKGVSIDSRTIGRGELFICIKGKRFDGSNFLRQIKRKGAICAVVPKGVGPVSGIRLMEVEDTQQALGDIAKRHRAKFDIPVIAITGSSGKTTTKDLIAHMLSKRFKVLKTKENNNNKIGSSLTLLKLKDQDVAVIEMGTSFPNEISYQSSIVACNVAVITNIGPSHLEGLGDTQGVFKEKFDLIRSLRPGGVWIKNADDKFLRSRSLKGIKNLDFGINRNNLNFKAYNIKNTNGKIEFKIRVDTKADGLRSLGPFRLPFLGVHNIYNILAAACSSSLFMDIDDIANALNDFKLPHMRTEVLGINGITVINDTYNSNPHSFKCAADTLREFTSCGKKIMVIADMLELGKDTDKLHYDLGRYLAQDNFLDLIVTFGRVSVNMAKGAQDSGVPKENVRCFKSKDKIVRFLNNNTSHGDVILVKGSRAMKMEEVVEGLKGK